MRYLIAILFLSLALPGVAEACTATSTIRQAQRIRASEEYKVIRDVVVSEVADPEEWVYNESVESGIGVVIFESWVRRSRTGYEVDLKNRDDISEHLDADASIIHRHPRTRRLVKRVRDHVIFHGQEWEMGRTQWGRPLKGWYRTPREEKPETFDHAG